MADQLTTVELLDYEISHGTQRSVAVFYMVYFLARAYTGPEVSRVNKAITERWSMAGLDRTKKMAWDIYDDFCKARAA